MCGRFTIVDPRAIAARYAKYRFLEDVPARYNVAPTDHVPAVCDDRAPVAQSLEWGFISGRPGVSNAVRTVNARSETVAEKPLFREALRARRCIVFADGYYEWMTDEKRKRPFHFTVDGGAPFAFAALWNPGLGTYPRTRWLLTTTPNSVQRGVHDRSPVILADDDALDVWLSGCGAAEVMPLLAPLADHRVTAREVDARVSSVRNDDALCLAPPSGPVPLGLFDPAP